MKTKKMVFTGLFIAIGVLSAHLIYIPVGIAKCFPVQHAINILLAVLLGTRYTVSAAFATSVLRNALGTGSFLAFPGSMIGALLSGILYRKTNHILGAVVGEVIGTGIIGGLVAAPLVKYFVGSQPAAFFYVVPFLVSSAGGAVIAYLLYYTPVVAVFREQFNHRTN
ncbi:MAG: energy coupling factor transporter S component ThiW [Negativicutes bacterium]|nr:energy coupling factor transporter S component ThiW [Negativicutes bacterium]